MFAGATSFKGAAVPGIPGSFEAGGFFPTACSIRTRTLETRSDFRAPGSFKTGTSFTTERAFKAGAPFGPGCGRSIFGGIPVAGRPALAFAVAFAGRPAFAFALTFAARRHRRAEFIFADFAVAVPVESLQCGGGVGDFRFGKLTILVGVQRSQQGGHGTGATGRTGATGSTRTGTAGRIAAFRLSLRQHGADGERQSNEDWFHIRLFGCGWEVQLWPGEISRMLSPWHRIVKALCHSDFCFVKLW